MKGSSSFVKERKRVFETNNGRRGGLSVATSDVPGGNEEALEMMRRTMESNDIRVFSFKILHSVSLGENLRSNLMT